MEETTFKVPLTRILKVQPHPNADRLSIYTVYGFECVGGLDQFREGDLVYYIPIDSVIPEWLENDVFKTSKIKPKKGRIRQVRIRGFASQGLLINTEVISDSRFNEVVKEETDVSVQLGIKKYEPPTPKFQQPGEKKLRDKPYTNPYFRTYNGISNLRWEPGKFEGEDVVLQCKLHGSHVRFGKAPFVANTVWKKIKKFFGYSPKFEEVYGSNNIELTNRRGYTGYYGSDVYGAALEKIDAFSKIKDGEFWHGELIGPGVQKGYTYGHIEHHVVMFDVRVMQEDGTQRWLDPEEAESLAKERGFDFVPVLYKGMYSLEVVKQYTSGPSVYCPAEKIREGCVVKARHGYDSFGSKRSLKSINPDYLDGDHGDNH